MISHIIEAARWLGVVASFAAASTWGDSPTAAINIIAPSLVLAVAGLTALEGLLFARSAAQSSGYAASPYQRQSAFNNLALACTSILAVALGWGPAASVTLLTTLLIFLALSGCNHLWSALAEGNIRARSFLRPAATAALILASLPYLWSVPLS